jgi:sulfane dehydrogenase subunit SoxC
MTEPTDADNKSGATSRRRFLRESSALLGGAVMVGGLAGSEPLTAAAAAGADNLPPNVPEWMKTPGDAMGSQPYGAPSPFEKGVIKNIPTNLQQYLSASGRTPLQDLDGIITPNGLFYERHHGGVPAIDPAQHRLMLHGMVDKPLIFTMDDIRRFPSESHIYFLECSGNPEYKKPYGKTASDLVGLLSCAEWTGVSLTRCWYTARTASGCARSKAIRCGCWCRVSKAT